MAKTKYRVELNDEEIAILRKIVCEGSAPERTIMRAKILLMSDMREEKQSVPQLAKLLGTTNTTIQTVRTEYGKYGFHAALYRKARTISMKTRRINDSVRAQILEMIKEAPPEGKKRWSVRTIAKAAIDRGIIDYISPATVASILNSRKIGKDNG